MGQEFLLSLDSDSSSGTGRCSLLSVASLHPLGLLRFGGWGHALAFWDSPATVLGPTSQKVLEYRAVLYRHLQVAWRDVLLVALLGNLPSHVHGLVRHPLQHSSQVDRGIGSKALSKLASAQLPLYAAHGEEQPSPRGATLFDLCFSAPGGLPRARCLRLPLLLRCSADPIHSGHAACFYRSLHAVKADLPCMLFLPALDVFSGPCWCFLPAPPLPAQSRGVSGWVAPRTQARTSPPQPSFPEEGLQLQPSSLQAETLCSPTQWKPGCPLPGGTNRKGLSLWPHLPTCDIIPAGPVTCKELRDGLCIQPLPFSHDRGLPSICLYKAKPQCCQLRRIPTSLLSVFFFFFFP